MKLGRQTTLYSAVLLGPNIPAPVATLQSTKLKGSIARITAGEERRVQEAGARSNRRPAPMKEGQNGRYERHVKPVDLAQVADELYALAPAEFRSARDERADQARAAGDRGLAG